MKKASFIICALILSILVSLFAPMRSYAIEYPAEYKELLEEIRDTAVSKGLFTNLPNNEQTRDSIEKSDLSKAAKDFFLSTTFIGNALDLSLLCYSVRDLDNNGTPELLLSLPAGQLCSIYTIQRGVPAMIRDFWPRSRGAIYGNYLYNYGSNGAGYQIYYYYVMKGDQFKIVDGYKNIEGTLYDISDNQISKSKADKIDAKYQKLNTPTWHMLIPGLFSDVDYSGWYSEPVIWAASEGITSGTSETEFSPNASCTRAQMVTFLWRSQGSPEPSTSKSPFTDVSASAYYSKAVRWALENNITKGTSEKTFSPDATVSRAQTVTFLWRMKGSESFIGKNPFSDVKKGSYYYDAVLWAVGENITKGTSDSSFSPEDPCTRAQIVTFLYRTLCPDRFNLDVSEYISHMTRLVSALDMQKTTPWRFGTDLVSFPGLYSYSHNGLYYEYYGDMFSLKNENNKDITFYGTHLGDNRSEYESAFINNGWKSMGDYVSEYDNITSLGTIINGRKYYIQLNMDSDNNVVLWYFEPWTNGEYEEFYGQFGNQSLGGLYEYHS